MLSRQIIFPVKDASLTCPSLTWEGVWSRVITLHGTMGLFFSRTVKAILGYDKVHLFFGDWQRN